MQKILTTLAAITISLSLNAAHRPTFAQETTADHRMAKPLSPTLKCGDADGSGVIELADVTFLINFLYSGGPSPDPRQGGDQNCDGIINISDCTYLIAYIFDLGGAEPCCYSDAEYCPRLYTTSFDLETATQMADLAHWAYFPAADFSSGNITAECWEAVTFIESDPDFECDVVITGQEDTQLFLARDPWTSDIVVSFRGSGPLADWITDAQAANPADWVYEDGTVVTNSVHKGFLCAYQSIRAELRSKLATAINDLDSTSTARVYFTGHSLGGALATLAALDLSSWLVNIRDYDRDNVVLYTYGAPRSLKPKILADFRDRVPNAYAVIEKTDPVPYLLASYTQISNLIEINSKLDESGTVAKSRLEPINGELLSSCGPATNPVPPSFDFSGHDHKEYPKRLEAAVTPGLPNISLTVNNGYLRYQWSGDVQGPCDRVVLCEDCPDEFTNAQLLLHNWEWVADGNSQQTLIPKREGMRVAYIDGYNRVLKMTSPYVAKTPTSLTIQRQPLGAIVVGWKVADEGHYDYVALYNRNPNSAGPNGYMAGTKHLVLPDLDDRHTWTRIGGTYWIAYVTADAAVGGNRRILRVAGPIN